MQDQAYLDFDLVSTFARQYWLQHLRDWESVKGRSELWE